MPPSVRQWDVQGGRALLTLVLSCQFTHLCWTAAKPRHGPQWSVPLREAVFGDLWLRETWLVQISFRGSQTLVQTFLTSYLTTLYRKMETPKAEWAEWRGRPWQWLMPQALDKSSRFTIWATLHWLNLYRVDSCKIDLGSWQSIWEPPHLISII